METREALRRRSDVAEGDIDEIIGIAAELADADRPGASVAEIEAVARELQIDPKYVERAIEVLGQRREQVQRDAAARAQTTRRALLVGGAAMGVVALGIGGLAASGGQRLASAAGSSIWPGPTSTPCCSARPPWPPSSSPWPGARSRG